MNKIGSATLIVIALLAIIFVMNGIAAKTDYVNNDFLVFWLAGQSNWTQIDPYNSANWLAARTQAGATTMPEPEFLYPLPLAVLLAPLGLLPIRQAFILWGVLSTVITFLSILILFRTNKKETSQNYLLYALIIFTPLFPPLLLTLYLGQFSAFLLLFATLAVYFWQQEKDIWGGFFIAFFTLKPSIGLPLLVLTSLWLWKKKTRAFTGMILSALLLLVLGLLQDSHWVTRFLSIVSNKADNTFGYSATLWGISGLICQFKREPTIYLGIIVIVLFSLLNIRLFHKQKKENIPLKFGIILTSSLLFAPYLWPYDQLLLLIPITLSLLALLKNNISLLKLILTFIGISFAAIALGATANYLGHQHENLYAFLSLLVWGINIWTLNWIEKPRRPQP